ncbi:hypothetical protein D9M72_83010 [compost metagenome]
MKDSSIILTNEQRPSAVLLLHPNYAAPAVVNPKARGAKKGCVNFMKHQRERDYRRLMAKEAELEEYRQLRARSTA